MGQNTKDDKKLDGARLAAVPAELINVLEGEFEVSLDGRVQEKLGEIFRDYCKSLIEQPIPDEFLVLLAKIEAKERRGV